MEILSKYNSRKVKGILIIAVAALWIFIIFKVYGMFTSSPKITTNYKTTSNVVAYNISVDTFNLSLDYKDPFGNYFKKVTKKATKETTKKKKKEKKTIEPNKNCIREVFFYKGMIKTNDSDKNTVLIKQGTKSLFIAESQFFGDYQLYRVFKDSVIIKKDNCYKTVYRD